MAIKQIFSKKGFTLAEVIVVAAVIAVLAAVVVVSYISVSDKAQKNLCIANQRMIHGAALTHLSVSDPKTFIKKSDKARLNELVKQGFIKNRKVLKCPSSTTQDYNDYTIVFEGDKIIDVECKVKPAEHKWP
ncbi:MAG: prepilin-type N-terminal cleavage/methylation domain-containing protein [Candidatus Omnitrophota bacterium]